METDEKIGKLERQNKELTKQAIESTKAIRSLEMDKVDAQIKVNGIDFSKAGGRDYPSRSDLVTALAETSGIPYPELNGAIMNISQLTKPAVRRNNVKSATTLISCYNIERKKWLFGRIRALDRNTTSLTCSEAIPDARMQVFKDCWAKVDQWKNENRSGQFMVKLKRDGKMGSRMTISHRQNDKSPWSEKWSEEPAVDSE